MRGVRVTSGAWSEVVCGRDEGVNGAWGEGGEKGRGE